MSKTKVKRFKNAFRKTKKNKRNKRTLKRKYNKRGGVITRSAARDAASRAAYSAAPAVKKIEPPAAPAVEERDHCPICLDDDADQELCSIIPCGHKIHLTCYDQLPPNNLCPICRGPNNGLTCGGIEVRRVAPNALLPAPAHNGTAEQFDFYELVVFNLELSYEGYEDGTTNENKAAEELTLFLINNHGFPPAYHRGVSSFDYVIPLPVWNESTGTNWPIGSAEDLAYLNQYLDPRDSISIRGQNVVIHFHE
jgi:hypothetical protein